MDLSQYSQRRILEAISTTATRETEDGRVYSLIDLSLLARPLL